MKNVLSCKRLPASESVRRFLQSCNEIDAWGWQVQEGLKTATWRYQMNLLAIDPLALMLRNDIYVKINLPNPPPTEMIRQQVRDIIRTMGPEERMNAMNRAKNMGAFAAAMEKELGSVMHK